MPQIVAPHIKFPDWRPFFKCRRKCNKRQLKATPKIYKNYGKAKGGKNGGVKIPWQGKMPKMK